MSGIGGYDDVKGSVLELEVDGRLVKVLSLRTSHRYEARRRAS